LIEFYAIKVLIILDLYSGLYSKGFINLIFIENQCDSQSVW